MPSSYTASLRLTLQATGENLNTWGNILNSGVFQLVDTAIAGRFASSASGAISLTAISGASDQARNAILDITGGTGATITAPAVSKIYFASNASSGDLVFTTGGATNATLQSGERIPVFSDGTNFYRLRLLNMQGERLQNLATPTGNNDAVTKAYADGLAFASTDLPGINSGTRYFTVSNDGSAALWKRTLPVSSASTAGKALKSTGIDGYPEDTSQWDWDGFQGNSSKSANYPVVLTDRNKVLLCTNTITLSLTAAATLGNKFCVSIVNNGTGLVTIDPNGTETITFPRQSAKTTIILVPGEGIDLYCDGSNFTAEVSQQAGMVFYSYEETIPSYVDSLWNARLPATISVNKLGITYSAGTLQNVPPGRYRALVDTLASGVNGFACRLYNSTAAAAIAYGNTGAAPNYGGSVYISGWAHIDEEFELTTSSNLLVQNYSSTSAVGAQWGTLLSSAIGGAVNKFAEIRLIRVGP